MILANGLASAGSQKVLGKEIDVDALIKRTKDVARDPVHGNV